MKAIRLVPITEIARRARKCSVTLRRQVEASQIEPDALLVQGSRKPTPLYVEPRAKLLLKLLKPNEDLH